HLPPIDHVVRWEAHMWVLARLRLQLARHPSLWWMAVGTVALVVAIAVAGSVRRLEQQRHSWGARRTVWVAVDGAAAGEAVRGEARDYPVALVPADAVDRDPGEATARQSIAPGEVLVDGDVVTGGTPALVPPGWIGVPVAQRASVVRTGDAV